MHPSHLSNRPTGDVDLNKGIFIYLLAEEIIQDVLSSFQSHRLCQKAWYFEGKMDQFVDLPEN